MFCGSTPDGEEGDGGSGEGDEEAEPEAGGSEVGVEAEQDAERHSDDPVTKKMGEERGEGVAGSAQGAGDGDLDAVEELEAGGDEKQRDGGGDDAAVRGEDACEDAGHREKDDRGEEHEGGAGEDAAPSGGVGGLRWSVAGANAADGMADADGGGGRDGVGDHEGGAGELQSDLVPGERERAEGGDERGDGGEDGDLDKDLRSGGGSEKEEPAEMLELDAA